MIQFITNHPYWASIILYLIIGFILGTHHYFYETWRSLEKKGLYKTKNEVLSEYLGISISCIPLWFIYIIGDILDLYISINRRY
jgi:Sec-independent protein secretion pathway component TatC